MSRINTLSRAAALATLALASTAVLAQRAPVAASVTAALPAGALFVDIDIAGFEAFGDYGNPGNSLTTVDIGTDSSVLGYEWINLSFTAEGFSWQEEFVLSVNDSLGINFMDVAPAFGVQASGTFGPAGGTWGVDGLSVGEPFDVLPDGILLVTVYDYEPDAGRNAIVNSGTLRVFYQPIPEPGTYGLMALGLLGVAAAARRRKAD
jgi:hypothetical protein